MVGCCGCCGYIPFCPLLFYLFAIVPRGTLPVTRCRAETWPGSAPWNNAAKPWNANVPQLQCRFAASMPPCERSVCCCAGLCRVPCALCAWWTSPSVPLCCELRLGHGGYRPPAPGVLGKEGKYPPLFLFERPASIVFFEYPALPALVFPAASC